MLPGKKQLFIKIIAFLLFILIPFSVSAGEDKKIIETLTEKAFEKKLFDNRYWHILLHYKKKFKGCESVIDDPEFFFSENGKNNPKEELEEAIKIFFSENENSSAAVCRFYARYRWLKQELDPENKITKNYICKDFENFEPGVVSLVFPTYYLNNPASMFGHTLLVINTKTKRF